MGLRTYNEIRRGRGLLPFADKKFDEPILPHANDAFPSEPRTK
jgi:hypothetical protein